MPDDESPLKRAIRRLTEATAEPNPGHGPDCYVVRGYDVGLLFETLKRYGGRHDWTPSEANIERLPGPVRRLVYAQRLRIGQLERLLIESENARRRLQATADEMRRQRR